MHVILFKLFFNTKNHYNYPVRKAIWIRASKLPFLNCLYQKLNSIKFHNFDNEQHCSLSAVLLNAASCGCLEGQDYRGKRQALPSECPSPALSLRDQPWPIPRATSHHGQTLSMHWRAHTHRTSACLHLSRWRAPQDRAWGLVHPRTPAQAQQVHRRCM